VLTSCRGTQLANDATVENGTSVFTQHLVDGLVDAAADQDGDGYVTFSDLYAYVDRRLRAAGKQIPQRRVDGDGDLRMAKRLQPMPVQTAATPPLAADSAPVPADGRAADTAPVASGPGRRTPRPQILLAVAAAAAAITGGVIAALVLLLGGPGRSAGTGGNPGTSSTITASAPWRLRVIDDIRHSSDGGCNIILTDANGNPLIEEEGI
jgi:hypothetical protein